MNHVTRRLTVGKAASLCGLLAVACAVVLVVSRRPGEAEPALSREAQLRAAGWAFHPIDLAIPAGRSGLDLSMSRAELASHALFLKAPSGPDEWVQVDASGSVLDPSGTIGQVERHLELLVTPAGTALFVDDAPIRGDVTDWQPLWLSAKGADPGPAMAVIPQLSVRDDFMREDLEEHPFARITGGNVVLAQRGGGMATTLDEKSSANFQRAVNPFAVHASEGGRLTYTTHAPRRWGDALAEAAFYFGRPKTGDVVDRDSIPHDTEMLVVMGRDDGPQTAFGWSGQDACFVLRFRRPGGAWETLSRWRSKRPPVTNWVRIGLACRHGHTVEGRLDGVTVLTADLGTRLRGPFHIQGGDTLIEFDDVRAWSLPLPVPAESPLRVRSRQFAGKKRKGNADPEEFDQWASSSHAFERVSWREEETRTPCAAIVTGAPLLGRFTYEAPDALTTGRRRDALYRIALYPGTPDGDLDVTTAVPAADVTGERTDRGWVFSAADGRRLNHDSPEDRFTVRRSAAHGDRLCVRLGGRWEPVSGPVSGPVHLAIIRTIVPSSRARFIFAPNPADHAVSCSNLVHELFEEAPTRWSWLEGAFRMDCRWACQDQWNFMACGATGVPAITSTRFYSGDQVHEVFMCLRATFPWDAGDTTFVFDSDEDRAGGHKQIQAHRGWYNRHDLNVSFCSNGRDLFSGYTVMFGAEQNTVTRLLRRGEVIAETRRAEHLFPTAASFMVVHYPWWRFTCTKTGRRITIALDGDTLFDFEDPEPIAGGRVSYWSVRNGFAIARASSMAERIEDRPHDLYVSNLPDDDAHGWRPLVRDTVRLSADSGTGLTQVTNLQAGGFFAVRHRPSHPVDLSQTPELVLPLDLVSAAARVNLHLEIDERAYLVRLGAAPLSGMKAFLVPENERGECFQLEPIPQTAVRAVHCLAEIPAPDGLLRIDLLRALRTRGNSTASPTLTCLTIGNSSNADDLMAGRGGNPVGGVYFVGRPEFRATP